MAIIEFPAAVGSAGVEYYIGGKGGASRVVGNDWKDGGPINRVVRYTITPPPVGASEISLVFNTDGLKSGVEVPLRFYIGTDPNSHINAWDTSEYTGELTKSADGYSFTAEAKTLLIPGATYYLFVFPATKSFGYYTWYRYGNPIGLSMGLSGGAGIVYIGNADGGADMYQFFTRICENIYLLLPHIGEGSGSGGGGGEAIGKLFSLDGYALRDSSGRYLAAAEITGGRKVLSLDGYILKDSNGHYLLAKEAT